MWAARAPQATTSTAPPAFLGDGCGNGPPITGPLPQPSDCSVAGLEAELVDEAVVEVAPVAEFDIVHLLKEGQGGGTVADREQGHLGALACHVACGDDAAGGPRRGEGEPACAFWGL